MRIVLLSGGLVALGFIAGCSEPDPTKNPDFHPETAADPSAVINQMSPEGKSSAKPGAAEVPQGSNPATTPGTNP